MWVLSQYWYKEPGHNWTGKSGFTFNLNPIHLFFAHFDSASVEIQIKVKEELSV
jgi:hypothetical protein